MRSCATIQTCMIILTKLFNRMTTLPHAEYVIRKKSYSPHYIPSNLALFQPELQDFSLKLTDVRCLSPVPAVF